MLFVSHLWAWAAPRRQPPLTTCHKREEAHHKSAAARWKISIFSANKTLSGLAERKRGGSERVTRPSLDTECYSASAAPSPMILPCPCVTLGSTATADEDADKSGGAERECDPFCALPFVTSEIRVRDDRSDAFSACSSPDPLITARAHPIQSSSFLQSPPQSSQSPLAH